MKLICPECSGNNLSCNICDGGKYITKYELAVYLNKIQMQYRISLPSQRIKIELDLTELEEDQL